VSEVGAAGTAAANYRVAREAADDVAGRLALALQTAPGMTVIWPGSEKIATALLPVVDAIAEERARQRTAEELDRVLDDVQSRTRDGADRDGWAAVAGIALDILNRKSALDGAR
jgi:hypothetical protein